MPRFSGQKVKALRGRRNQTDLAAALQRRGFGTTQTQVSRWESGQTPRKIVLPALAAELGCEVSELFEATDDEEDDMGAPLTRAVLREVLAGEIRAALLEARVA